MTDWDLADAIVAACEAWPTVQGDAPCHYKQGCGCEMVPARVRAAIAMSVPACVNEDTVERTARAIVDTYWPDIEKVNDCDRAAARAAIAAMGQHDPRGP
jgi:hypothetical protein